MLWINQPPDREADAATDKNNLVVRLGKARARRPYLALMALPIVTTVVLVATRWFPANTLAVILAVPLVARILAVFFREWNDPRAIVPAQALTIKSHLAETALLTLGLTLRP